MSEHVDCVIADLTAKRDKLSELSGITVWLALLLGALAFSFISVNFALRQRSIVVQISGCSIKDEILRPIIKVAAVARTMELTESVPVIDLSPDPQLGADRVVSLSEMRNHFGRKEHHAHLPVEILTAASQKGRRKIDCESVWCLGQSGFVNDGPYATAEHIGGRVSLILNPQPKPHLPARGLSLAQRKTDDRRPHCDTGIGFVRQLHISPFDDTIRRERVFVRPPLQESDYQQTTRKAGNRYREVKRPPIYRRLFILVLGFLGAWWGGKHTNHNRRLGRAAFYSGLLFLFIGNGLLWLTAEPSTWGWWL